MKSESSTKNSTSGDAAVVGGETDYEALLAVIEALQRLDTESRVRILDSAATFLGIRSSGAALPAHVKGASATSPAAKPDLPSFSEDRSMSPKEFLLEKQPRTDVERVGCLAYYLTHYRGIPHFKTLDLSKLNTEAAQPKFSNAANATNNAVKRGYLVAATKGQRQLSAAGEQFIQALPDREKAKAAMAGSRPQKRKRRTSTLRKKKP